MFCLPNFEFFNQLSALLNSLLNWETDEISFSATGRLFQSDFPVNDRDCPLPIKFCIVFKKDANQYLILC